MLDLKKHELSRLIRMKYSNEGIFAANISSLHNVRDHPNKKILAPNFGDSYNHDSSLVVQDPPTKDS